MDATGSRLFLISLLSCLLRFNPSLTFSLKNCSLAYSDDGNNLWVLCKGRFLATIPDDIPRNVTSLDLNTNNLLKISGADFKYLSKLTYVDIGYNSISRVDDGAFADLGKLRMLNMGFNELTDLTDDMFKGLSGLLWLYLSYNRISSISPEAFQPLVSLQTVELSSNNLYYITDFAPVLKLPTLHNLFVGYNKLTSFQSDDLPLNTSNLKLLFLSMNPLSKFSIKKDVFPYLQSLDFSMCSGDLKWDVANKTFLRSLTYLCFSGGYISCETYKAMLQTAGSLQRLQLAKMKTCIDEGIIDIACQIPSLQTLDFTVSSIGTINDNLLQCCSQVTELILSFNDVSILSERSLSSMTKLRLLQLNNNYLIEMPSALRGLATLETLDLSSNFISKLDCLDFLGLTQLVDLNLNNNRISKLLGCVFQKLSNLQVLNIGENAFFTFDNTFKVSLSKLTSLNLHNNGPLDLMQGDFKNLSSLSFLDLESDISHFVRDGAFEGLDNVRTLILSISNYEKDTFRGLEHLENLTLHHSINHNQRSSQHSDEPPFSNLPNLKRLIIKYYNKFHWDISPDLLKGLKSLEYFMTEKFFVKSMHPDMFKYTPQLKGLQIIHSELSELVPELFWPIPNLQALDLSNNKFRSLGFLADLKALRWLKLSENSLSVINNAVIESLPALTYLDLTDNPLTCECSNAAFNQWVLSSNETQVFNGHQYSCAFPVSQQGNKFLDFDVHACWIDAGFLCFLSSTCLVVFTLLSCFIYHFLRQHLVYACYLFLAFLYDKKRRKNNSPYHYDAFVSYNVHDEDWVYREMVPALEGHQGWRLCLHHRDFEPGKPILENITEAIYSSRKTICVISRHYLQSEWCSTEIQMASFRLFDEQKDVLILLFMEDIPAWQLSLYHRIRSLVKRHSYLSWPQAGRHTGVFWQGVRRALETAERPAENQQIFI